MRRKRCSTCSRTTPAMRSGPGASCPDSTEACAVAAPDAIATRPAFVGVSRSDPPAVATHGLVDVARAEWVWVALITLLVLGLTQIPPTAERLLGPTDRVHVGS